MKPMTLFLLDPSPEEVGGDLAEGRVAAVFTDADKRQAVRTAFAAKAKGGELIDLGTDNLRPFAPSRCAGHLRSEQVPHILVGAALAFLGVPETVVVTSGCRFGIVADALRKGVRTPRSLRFKGWPEGRRQELLSLGFDNVAVIGTSLAGGGAGAGMGVAAGPQAAEPGRVSATDTFEGYAFHAWR